MKTALTITIPVHGEGYDLKWEPQGNAAIRWDDSGWIMETWRDGAVVDLWNVDLYNAVGGIDWNAVMARVEELTK